jgi:hypothetical protein
VHHASLGQIHVQIGHAIHLRLLKHRICHNDRKHAGRYDLILIKHAAVRGDYVCSRDKTSEGKDKQAKQLNPHDWAL